MKLSLKKKAKGTICPLQNLGEKLRRKHTRRNTVSTKKQAETQTVGEILLHVYMYFSVTLY